MAPINMGVSKNRGKIPKMDGENNGKPYEQMDDLGIPLIFGNAHIFPRYFLAISNSKSHVVDPSPSKSLFSLHPPTSYSMIFKPRCE